MRRKVTAVTRLLQGKNDGGGGGRADRRASGLKEERERQREEQVKREPREAHGAAINSLLLPRNCRDSYGAARMLDVGSPCLYTTYLIQRNASGGRKYAQNVKDCPVRTMPEMERDLCLSMGFKRRFATWNRFIQNSLIVILSRRRYLFDDQNKQERLIRLDFYDDI